MPLPDQCGPRIRWRAPRAAATLDHPVSYTLLGIYCLGIVGASLVGGAVPSLLRLTHRRLQVALSFVAGAMLGVALFHMLPHAALEVMGQRFAAGEPFGHGDFDRLIIALIGGFLAMFLLERFARFHRHEPEESMAADPESGEACAHHGAEGPGRSGGRRNAEPPVHAAQWAGALVGLSLHSLLEGVALAAAVLAGSGLAHGHDHGNVAGLGVFLVILLHKPFDSMTLLTLFRASQSRRALRRALLLNLVFALIVPLGAAAFCLGAMPFVSTTAIVPLALAFCAGTFLCIATSDLLPELQFHRHDRAALSAALVLGLALAWAIGLFESDLHDHAHPGAGPGAAACDHGHPHDHDPMLHHAPHDR